MAHQRRRVWEPDVGDVRTFTESRLPLLRRVPSYQDAAPLSFPVKGVYGTQDDRCTSSKLETWSSVAPDFELLGSVEGHHLFVYDESARVIGLRLVVQALDGAVSPIASGPPRARYECTAPKGRPSEKAASSKAPSVVGRRGGWLY